MKKQSKRHALISGGAGFIGSHLVDSFLSDGWRVTVLDNLCTGTLRNLSHLGEDEALRTLIADVSEDLPDLPETFDAVLHLASPASPIDFDRLSLEILQVGSTGTRNMLEVARRDNATFLMASTSEVYGDPDEHPQREEYWGFVNPIGPRSCYDESKRFSEALIMSYRRRYGLKTRIARIFNTYGPRNRTSDGRVVPAFIWAAIHDQPLTIFGDGSQTRSFCFVSDLVRGLRSLLESDYHLPVNLGNPAEMTVLEFADLVIKLSGSKSERTFHGLPEDDPKRRRPDTSVAGRELGWEPLVTPEVGLAKTIEFYRGLEA